MIPQSLHAVVSMVRRANQSHGCTGAVVGIWLTCRHPGHESHRCSISLSTPGHHIYEHAFSPCQGVLHVVPTKPVPVVIRVLPHGFPIEHTLGEQRVRSDNLCKPQIQGYLWISMFQS